MLSNLKRPQIFSSVSALFGRNLLAQFLPLLISPILARLFAPEHFGEWALFIAVSSIIASVACLRYEVAVALPKSNRQAILLIELACQILLLTFFIISIVCLVIGFTFYSSVKSNNAWIFYVPVGALLISGGQILVSYQARMRKFERIGNARIVQSGVTSVINLLSGNFLASLTSAAGSMLLVVASIAGQFISCFYLYKNQSARLFRAFTNFRIRRKVLIKYSDMAIYSTPEALINVLLQNLPVLFFSALAIHGIAGEVAVVNRIVAIPVATLSGAVSTVLMQQYASIINDENKIRSIAIKSLFAITFLVGPFFLFFFHIRDDFFLAFLGEQWVSAGDLSGPIIIYGFVLLASSVLSPLHVVFRLQHLSLAFALSQLLIKLSILFAWGEDVEPVQILWLFLTTDVIHILVINFFLYKKIKSKP